MQTADAQRTSHGTQAKTMQAIRIHRYGGPEVMQLEEVPMPVPQAGQALLRVHAASVNFLDVQKRRGELVGQAFYHRASEPVLPTTLGSQGVGVVEALGPEVGNVMVGDRVSFAGESYASHAVVPAVRLIRISRRNQL
jgi:NADPH:quinone reductase